MTWLNESDLKAVKNRAGKPELDLVVELLRSDCPRQAIPLVEILAFFPGVMLDGRFRGRGGG